MIITISSVEDIKNRKFELNRSAMIAKERLFDIAKKKNAFNLLADLRFNQVGCDPLESSRSLNFIEQLNQTFTYFASLLAVEYLIKVYPTATPFLLNLGATKGVDIESPRCGGIGAEVFAAVNPNNNNKLHNDCKKISATTGLSHKYVFFMCPGFTKGPQANYPQFPDVSVVAVPYNQLPQSEDY